MGVMEDRGGQEVQGTAVGVMDHRLRTKQGEEGVSQ